MCNILAGADYHLGEIGTLDALMTVSYEKTILDEEITSRLLYIKNGIDVSQDAASLDVIQEVGSGGTFLIEEDTLEYMHDVWYPRYTDWNRTPEKCPEGDYEYVVRRLNEQWKQRLEQAPESMLDPEVSRELDAYVDRHK